MRTTSASLVLRLRAWCALLLIPLLALCAQTAHAVTYITFLRPSVPEAQYVNGRDLTVKVTSPNIVQVKLTADGYAFGSPLTAANGWSINYTFSQIGSRNLVGTGYDAAGAVVSSTSIRMTVVDVYPSQPRPNTVYGNGTPITVVTGPNVAKVNVYADVYLIGTSSTRGADGVFTVNPAVLNQLGNRSFKFVGYNAAGMQIDSQAFTVTVQNVGFTAPLNGSNVVAGAGVDATVSAASNVARVEYYQDGAWLGTSSDRATAFKVRFTAGAVGTHTLEARAFDAAGVQVATFSISISATAVPVVNNDWGVWLFQFESVAGVASTHAELAQVLKGMGVRRIYIKVADGSRSVLSNGYTFPLNDPTVPAAYKAQGIQPWAWAYNYPANRSSASGQGATLYAAAKSGYVGFVSDIESEFQAESSANQVAVFQAFASARQAAIADGYATSAFKLYETSFGQIDLQPNIAISQIDAYVDAHMPQTYSVYWGSSREADQVATINWINGKYRARGATKPLHHITSIERHYDSSGTRHEMTPARLQTFLQNGGFEASVWALPASGDGSGEQDIPFSSWNNLLKAINWNAKPN